MLDNVVRRRILGTAAVVLLIALGKVGLDFRYAPPAGSYTVTAILGDAGSGLGQDSDIKVRGTKVGSVEDLRFEDATALATLRLDPGVKLPPPEDIELVVTAKTLLGEKQIELSFPDEVYGTAPYLEEGDVLRAAREPTELQEVLDEMAPFFDAIGGEDLGAIVDALGAQQGEGERIAENIDLSQQLANFGGRTAEQSLENLRNFADVVGALETTAEDFNRLNDVVPRAAGFLPDNQARVRTNLDALSEFAVGLGRFLEVEEETISAFQITSNMVGVVVDRHPEDIGSLVEGIYYYTSRLGKHGGLLTDGTEWGGFIILLSEKGIEQTLLGVCDAFPDAPVCSQLEGGGADGR
ncbi:MAG: MCE family protein [Nitriliruptorales bacterium]|nr:MCE family protein [Nitriliruptorales bacterium]